MKLCIFNGFSANYFYLSILNNSGRSVPKAEVTSANSQTEVTLANFYISGLFHATTGI